MKLDNLKEDMSKNEHVTKKMTARVFNIISQGFLMAVDLNEYFSSVFAREDINSLPVLDAKFQEAKLDNLGQLTGVFTLQLLPIMTTLFSRFGYFLEEQSY